MKKLCDIIASRLQIQTSNIETEGNSMEGVLRFKMSTFSYTSVSDNVKKKFSDELFESICRWAKDANVEDVTEYLFECGQVRPLGTIREDSSDNMALILASLPELESGKYWLPMETYFGFKLTNKDGDNFSVKPFVCNWIVEAYTK